MRGASEKSKPHLTPAFFFQPRWLAKESSHTVAYSSMHIIVKAHVTFVHFSKQHCTPDHHFSVTKKKMIWWQSWSNADLQPLHSPTYCRMVPRQQTHVENYFRKMLVLRLALTTEEAGTAFNWQPVRLLKWGIQKLSRKSERTLCLPDVVVFVLFCFNIPFPRCASRGPWPGTGAHQADTETWI